MKPKEKKISSIIQNAGLIICFILFIIGWVKTDVIWMVGTGFLMLGFAFNLIALKLKSKEDKE